jgi:hypothetical protein
MGMKHTKDKKKSTSPNGLRFKVTKAIVDAFETIFIKRADISKEFSS